jgi:hypothetical protein
MRGSSHRAPAAGLHAVFSCNIQCGPVDSALAAASDSFYNTDHEFFIPVWLSLAHFDNVLPAPTDVKSQTSDYYSKRQK